MKKSTLTWTASAIATLVVMAIVTAPAFAGDYGEYDNWGTQFTTNPLVCSGPNCSVTSMEMGIQPTGLVDRTETITMTGAPMGSMATGQTFLPGSGMCVTGNADGCLVFNNIGGANSSLILNYAFHDLQTFSPNLGLQVTLANTGAVQFDVTAYYKQGMNFTKIESALIPVGFNGIYTFDFASNVSTDGIEIIYNDTNVADADGVLCCVMQTPEIDPGSGMKALALLSGALVVIRGRKKGTAV